MMSLYKRISRNPFRKGEECLILHTAHHKIGTSWFKNILKGVAHEFGLRFFKNAPEVNHKKPAIYFQSRPFFDLASLVDFKGTHMIRDPRDVVISGYYYHLWTKENWAIVPIRELPANMEEAWPLLPIREIGHMSYQEYLCSLPREEGILAEIKRSSTDTIRDMIEWDYNNPAIFEFKYEDIIEDEEGVFREIFHHYGFTADAVDRGWEIARKFSFKNRARRNLGDVENRSHLRSGAAQQWRKEFNEEHKALFKELHGQDLIDLGYERDFSW